MDNFIKEKVAYYKLWLTLLYTTDAGLIAWFFNNYVKIGNIKFLFIVLNIAFVSLLIGIFVQKIRMFLEKLSD